ncbi:hypothetical protein LJC32_04165 [Oscillospiraceae bacterium OttesenSCG-928-F05]|nr:hypothetical protein [Oscillospiraceae bacterium OttesenSCG-928-F05]
MLKQHKSFALFVVGVMAMYIVGWVLIVPASDIPFDIPMIRTAGTILIALAGLQTAGYIVWWCIYHKLYKGVKYARMHARLLRNIKMALLDAGSGYVKEQYSGEEKVVTLPRIKISLSDDLTGGEVQIRNHIRYDMKLDKVNLSSALDKYIVKEKYTSSNENWHIFEFVDSEIDNQLVFNSYDEFVDHCKKYPDYILFMDSQSSVNLFSFLLVGAAGSGKTYSLYSLILNANNWTIRPKFYFADPKITSLYVLGKKVAPEKTAGDIDEIILLLDSFHQKMQERKQEMQGKLEEKLDSDYRDWGLEPFIFVFDEFSSFQSSVNTVDKATRDKVAALLRNIVLQGRQLGFFLWIAMQKSDATDIPTAIRDNLIWKVVLGNAPDTTYQTAFEHSADLPKRKFKPGQGLYTYMGITRQPRVMSFPTLNFDILDAIKKSTTL